MFNDYNYLSNLKEKNEYQITIKLCRVYKPTKIFIITLPTSSLKLYTFGSSGG